MYIFIVVAIIINWYCFKINMTMALLLCGVHLVVEPLLVLTTDRVKSFTLCSDEHGTVIDLDNQSVSLILFLDQVIHLVLGRSAEINTTVSLFGSLQFLVKILRGLNDCSTNKPCSLLCYHQFLSALSFQFDVCLS